MVDKIGLLGGSFNPVHIGHLRLALEVWEAAGLTRVDFIPAARPPHKEDEELLPFSFRCRLLEQSIGNMSQFAVNALEGDRDGPSFTVDTLRAYKEEHPEALLYFLLGSTDFFTLPSWHKWRDIFSLTNLAVVDREGHGSGELEHFLNEYFPRAVKLSLQYPAWKLQSGNEIHFIPITRLDISSTTIRDYLKAGRPITYLVPCEIESLLVDKGTAFLQPASK